MPGWGDFSNQNHALYEKQFSHTSALRYLKHKTYLSHYQQQQRDFLLLFSHQPSASPSPGCLFTAQALREAVGLCITPGATWGLVVGDPMGAGVVPNRRSPGMSYPPWWVCRAVQKEQREEPKKDQKQSWKDSWKLWIGFIALEKVM